MCHHCHPQQNKNNKEGSVMNNHSRWKDRYQLLDTLCVSLDPWRARFMGSDISHHARTLNPHFLGRSWQSLVCGLSETIASTILLIRNHRFYNSPDFRLMPAQSLLLSWNPIWWIVPKALSFCANFRKWFGPSWCDRFTACLPFI